MKEIAQRLGLESAYRATGRPRKVGRNQIPLPDEIGSNVGWAIQFSIADLSRFSHYQYVQLYGRAVNQSAEGMSKSRS